MKKHLFSISLLISTLFVGLCAGNTADVYSHMMADDLEKIECAHCETFQSEEANCCDPELTRESAFTKDPLISAVFPNTESLLVAPKIKHFPTNNNSKKTLKSQVTLPKLE